MRILLFLIFFTFVFNENFSQVIYPYRTCTSPSELVEFSGIAKIENNLLVGINDGGNLPCLFFMDTLGKLIRKKCFNTIKNIDWEETFYSKGILYICDVGDNLSRRKGTTIYSYDVKKDSVVTIKKINFTEKTIMPIPKAKKNYDCEAAFMHDNKIYLFSKTHASPYKGISYQYLISVDDKSNSYTAIDSTFFGTQGFIQNSITGAAISSKKWLSAFISCTHVWFKFNFFKEPLFFKQVTMDFDFDGLTQKEAITFTSDFKFVVADERTAKMMGGRMYFFDLKPYIIGRKKYSKPVVNSASLKKIKGATAFDLSLKLSARVGTDWNAKPKKLHLLLFDKVGKCIHKSEIKGNSNTFKKKITIAKSDENQYKYAVGFWIIDDMQVIYGDKIGQ